MSLLSRQLRSVGMTQMLRQAARQAIRKANPTDQISQPREQSTSSDQRPLQARPRLSSRPRSAGRQEASESLGEGLATISKLAESLQDTSLLEELKAASVKQPKNRKGGTNGKVDRAVPNLTQKLNDDLFLASKKPKRKMENSRDEKISPSSQSGGVPEPTRQYHNIANAHPKLLEEAQHLLVIIDLNGTILYRPNKKQPTKFVARPHALRFLQYCIETFTVVIWSSARPENVYSLVEAIIPPKLRQQVVAIWARDQFGLSSLDYNQRVQCYKRLTRVWKDDLIARSHPEFAEGARWDQTNTVLVDDSYEKGRSEPYNIIKIPEFFGDSNEIGDILPQVHDCINQLSMYSNVSACLKVFPFRAKAAPMGPPRS